MLVKKGWKKNHKYSWNVSWKIYNKYLNFLNFTTTLERKGGLKKKKQLGNPKIIPEKPLDPPIGKIFWCDPI